MTVSVSIWSGVGVAMQSALATSQGASALTLAGTGVITYAGTDSYATGDYVLLSNVQGMTQVDDRVFRVTSVDTTANTFALEGENTSSYTAFTTGDISEVTFGTTVSTLVDLSASGGDFDFIDVTTIHDLVKKQIPGAANPITYTFNAIWDVNDAGMIAMKQASDNKAERAFKFRFANGQTLLFRGFVGCTLLPGGNAQDKVTSQVVITMFGRPTVYSTS